MSEPAASHPHRSAALVRAGVPPARARRVAVLVHGRDQDAQAMLDLAERLALADIAYLLPVASGGSWYAGRYHDPVATLEPQLADGLAALDRAIETAHGAGHPDARIVLAGFSQGACLVAEYVARAGPRRFAGAAVLTGSLVGTPEQRHVGGLAPGLPMAFASSRHDEWIAIEDARDTAERFRAAGAQGRFLELEDRVHRVAELAVRELRSLLTAG